MTTKELVSRFRAELKTIGVKARLHVCSGGGFMVEAPTFLEPFSDENQFKIKQIALRLGCSFVRSCEIDVERHTNPYSFYFEV
jgi:hypothetical protein